MASKTLKKALPILKYVSNVKSGLKRKRILKEISSDPHIYDAICEVCLNTVKGNIELSPADRKKLKSHKKCLVALASRKGARGYKRQLVVQSGGAILPILIPAVASIVSSIISAANKNG